jgi:hypothetical protein
LNQSPEDFAAFKLSKAKVTAALKRGHYDDLVATGFGRLDELMAFLEGFGVLRLFSDIKDELDRDCAIPRFVLYNLLALKALLGEDSLLHLSKGIFRDPGVLRAIGVTAAEMQAGFDTARNKKANKPFHIDSLRYGISKVPVPEVKKLFSDSVDLLKEGGFLRKAKTYVIDSTKITVLGSYEGMGSMTTEKKVVGKSGELKTELCTKKGFKLFTLAALTNVGPLVTAAHYCPIQTAEVAGADELLGAWGPHFRRGDLLLMDRGFIDGERLFDWHKDYGIDFVIPLKSDMDVLADMRGLSKLKLSVVAKRSGSKNKPDLVIEGYSDLESYASYPGKLSGILVTVYKGRKIEPEKRWGFITTLATATPDEALAVYDAYDKRSLIENQGYRELKQGFELPRYFGKNTRSQHFHIYFTLLMYNMVAAYKSKRAGKFIGIGVRRFRSDFIGLVPMVIVYASPYFAIFDIKEFVVLLGRPPTGNLDNVRIRYTT